MNQNTRDVRWWKLLYHQHLKESKVAMRNAQITTELLIQQQEDDRREISRELHDEIAQVLTGISFELAVIGKELSVNEEKFRAKIDSTQRLIQGSVEFIHQFALELRPMILDDLGLVPALKSYLKNFSRQHATKVTLNIVNQALQLNDTNKTVLFRVAQEALTNIAKHSRASKARISLRKIGKMIQLTVHDNGVSFNINRRKTGSITRRLGLLGMQERVRMVQGRLVIKARPGKGTSIIATVPTPGKS